MLKISLFHLLIFEIQSILESVTRMATPFLTMPTQKIFAFYFCESVSTYKKSVYSICSKTLQSDWLSAFWPISQEQDFSQI